MKKILFAFIMTACVSILFLSCKKGNESPITSGTFGDNNSLTWLFVDGTLTISGRGVIPDLYSTYERPWNSYSNDIKTVVVENYVMIIGKAAFGYCESLTSVTISKSVGAINLYAFAYCPSLVSVTIMSSNPPDLSPVMNFRAKEDTLYVPVGCVNAYKADATWNAVFTHIVEQQ